MDVSGPRALMAIEEHGGGRQLARFRTWSRCSSAGVVVIALFALLCGWAVLDHAWVASAILGAVATTLTLRTLWECSVASAAVLGVVDDLDDAVSSSATVDRKWATEA